MLTPVDIEKMMEEIGIHDENRAKFLEWSKQTLFPQTNVKVFFRLSNTTTEEEGREQEDGKLERNT